MKQIKNLWLATDQYGNKHIIDHPHPRKWLLDYTCRKTAKPIYQDDIKGNSKQVGWIIAGNWYTVYRLGSLKG